MDHRPLRIGTKFFLPTGDLNTMCTGNRIECFQPAIKKMVKPAVTHVSTPPPAHMQSPPPALHAFLPGRMPSALSNV